MILIKLIALILLIEINVSLAFLLEIADPSIPKSREICDLVKCRNGGTCFFTNNLAFCKCPDGFTGMWCQFGLKKPENTHEFTLCSFNHCLNNGVCILNEKNETECICPKEFYGRYCELTQFRYNQIENKNGIVKSTKEPSICSFITCLNGGFCIVTGNDFASCFCLEGYTGGYCEKTTTTFPQTTVTTTTTTQRNFLDFLLKTLNKLKNKTKEDSLLTTSNDGVYDKNNRTNQINSTRKYTRKPKTTTTTSLSSQPETTDSYAPKNLCSYLPAESYCRNGGTCISDNLFYFTCDCPVGFTGQSCEYKLIINNTAEDTFGNKTSAYLNSTNIYSSINVFTSEVFLENFTSHYDASSKSLYKYTSTVSNNQSNENSNKESSLNKNETINDSTNETMVGSFNFTKNENKTINNSTTYYNYENVTSDQTEVSSYYSTPDQTTSELSTSNNSTYLNLKLNETYDNFTTENYTYETSTLTSKDLINNVTYENQNTTKKFNNFTTIILLNDSTMNYHTTEKNLTEVNKVYLSNSSNVTTDSIYSTKTNNELSNTTAFLSQTQSNKKIIFNNETTETLFYKNTTAEYEKFKNNDSSIILNYNRGNASVSDLNLNSTKSFTQSLMNTSEPSTIDIRLKNESLLYLTTTHLVPKTTFTEFSDLTVNEKTCKRRACSNLEFKYCSGLNNASCKINKENEAECVCLSTYKGVNCSERYNFCVNLKNSSEPVCKNGGKCIQNEKYGGYCMCPSGTFGPKCEWTFASHSCKPNPCLNDSDCVNIAGKPYCLCRDGFEPPFCS